MAKEYINSGLESKEKGVAAIRALWKKADKMVVEEGAEYEWWPIEVISPDIKFSPRHQGRTNEGRVQRYAELTDVLPPIVVNKDGKLIDGKHRIEANALAGNQFIKVIVLDLAEDEVFERAYKANAEHGESYTDRERTNDAHRIWNERVAKLEAAGLTWKDMHQSDFAKEFGISRMTINRWLQDSSDATEAEKAKKKAEKDAEKAAKKKAAADKKAKDDGFHDVDEDDDDRPTFRGVTAPPQDTDDDVWGETEEVDESGIIFDRIADGLNAINELFSETDEIGWDHHLRILDVGGMNPDVIRQAAESLMKLSIVIQTGIEGQAEIAAEENGD